MYSELFWKPGFLQDMIRKVKEIEGGAATTENAAGRLDLASDTGQLEIAYCNCRPLIVQQSFKNIFNGLGFFSQISTPHLKDCPYSLHNESTRTLGLSLFTVNKLIGFATKVTFTLRLGAGGFAISPHLAFRGFSRDGSPAFRLFYELGWDNAKTETQYVAILRQIPARMRLLFANGEATPSETDEYGDTLLHVSQSLKNL